MTATIEQEAIAIAEAELVDLARGRFLPFVLYTFSGTYQVSKHHRIICRTLEKFEAGAIRRLIISMPPRHGKSALASRHLPAWILGRNPDARIIFCSYAATLAESMSRDTRQIISSPEYSEIFPCTALPTASDAGYKNTATEWQIPGRRGQYIAAGVGGGITGKGGNFLIIDDPIKDDIEAQSETHRERVWNWYTKVLKTRRAPDAGIVVIMTRWHMDDLAGRLLAQASADPDADQWHELRLPALAEETDRIPEEWREPGEALWPAFKTSEEWERDRREDPEGFSALAQQRPAPAGGAVIKASWCEQFWHALPQNGHGQWFWSMDAKAGSKDPSSSRAVVQLWFTPKGRPGELYLIDQIKGVWDLPETLAQLRLCLKRDPWKRAAAKLIENKADGKGIVATLKSEIPGLTLIDPQGSKIVRARAIARYWGAGNIWLPTPARAPWIGEFIHEVTTFPTAAHDDQVDAMTMAVAWAFNLGTDDPLTHLRRVTDGWR